MYFQKYAYIFFISENTETNFPEINYAGYFTYENVNVYKKIDCRRYFAPPLRNILNKMGCTLKNMLYFFLTKNIEKNPSKIVILHRKVFIVYNRIDYKWYFTPLPRNSSKTELYSGKFAGTFFITENISKNFSEMNTGGHFKSKKVIGL